MVGPEQSGPPSLEAASATFSLLLTVLSRPVVEGSDLLCSDANGLHFSLELFI